MDFYENKNSFSINSNLKLRRCHFRTNGTKTEYGSRHMVRADDRVVGELFASKSTSWVLIALNAEERTEHTITITLWCWITNLILRNCILNL